MMKPLPTGTITFLFTDIEGSTRLWESHPEPMRAAVARHDALLREAVEQNGGYLFKTTGDGVAAAFAVAAEGLAAALAAQQALLAEPWPSSVPLCSRMGLHTGAAELRDGDYFGTSLSRCARLMAAGHGGQLLLSDVAQELVRDTLPPEVTLRSLGEHRLKDLTRPETVYQAEHPALIADFPWLRTLDVTPNNLPRQLTSFVGRERELAQIRTQLDKTCLLTLTGAGGSGKTRLALQVAADALDDYPDGTWQVELASLADPGLVAQTVAMVLGVKEQPGHTIPQTLTENLRAKRLLLLLDNCEHLVQACAQIVAAILRSCPNVTVLATSREPLGIGGETTYRVPTLTLPSATQSKGATPASLSQFESVRLFVERAQSVKSDFAVTNGNAPALAQLCYRLDGIPLAIELAAARVRSLPVEQINDKLDSRFRLLTGGDRSALPRQQTLRALIDWSYELLTANEKTLLARLSVFAGGWTLEIAESVCGFASLDEWEILDLLTSLADKSLVQMDDQEGEVSAGTTATRYWMLETVRQYARENREASDEDEMVRTRHRHFFALLAEEAHKKLEGPEQVAWLNRLESEHDNLRAVLDDCATRGDSESALWGLRLSQALCLFWQIRGYLEEGREHLRRALTARESMTEAEAAEPEAARAAAGALRAAGLLAWSQGDLVGARSFYEESLLLCREQNDRQGIAGMLNNLGIVTHNQGDLVLARRLYEQSLALYRELNDKRGIASTLGNLSIIASRQDDYMWARTLLEESLNLRRELGDKRGIANSLSNLGDVACRQGDTLAAWSVQKESLSLFREIGDKGGIAYGLEGIAAIYSSENTPSQAVTLWHAAAALRASIGAPLSPAEQDEAEAKIAAARSEIGDEAFVAASAEGEQLSWEQAVAFALTKSAPA